jgi:carbon starvation protein
MSPNPKLGFFAGANDMAMKLAAGVLPADRAAVAARLIFNQRLDGWLTVLLTAILWLVILDMCRVCARKLKKLPVGQSSEAPYQVTRLEDVRVAAGLRGAMQGSH